MPPFPSAAAGTAATRRVLVIAGSDSSGGAGLEADQRVLALHNCYALIAITGVTQQTTTGVHAIHEIPTQFVLDTINAVWDDIGVDVVKIGMLTSATTAAGVASLLTERRKAGYTFAVVLDPVMKSTSGAALVDAEAAAVIRRDLLPLATVVTPNIPEAEILCSGSGSGSSNVSTELQTTTKTVSDLEALARRIWALNRKGAVLVKGGHAASAGSWVSDVLFDGEHVDTLGREYIETRNVHGTGCSLASAIAANLAHGLSVRDAVGKAAIYVWRGIRAARDWNLGRGNGPIDHWAGVSLSVLAVEE